MAKPKSIGAGMIEVTALGTYKEGDTILIRHDFIRSVSPEYLPKGTDIYQARPMLKNSKLFDIPSRDGLETNSSYLHLTNGIWIIVEGTIADVFAQIQVAKLTI